MIYWIRQIIQTLFLFALFINAFLYVPQAVKLLKTKDSSNLSIITFGGITLSQFLMLLHSIIVHDILLLLGSSMTLLASGFITFLIIYFHKNHSEKK